MGSLQLLWLLSLEYYGQFPSQVAQAGLPASPVPRQLGCFLVPGPLLLSLDIYTAYIGRTLSQTDTDTDTNLGQQPLAEPVLRGPEELLDACTSSSGLEIIASLPRLFLPHSKKRKSEKSLPHKKVS